MNDTPLPRRLLAEFLGTALLVTVVVGSGIAAQQQSPNDAGLQLLENSTSTVFGLGVLIVMFGPVSGAHFNPVVSLVDYAMGRRYRRGLDARAVASYVPTQVVGATAGAWLANAMFSRPVFEVSAKHRSSGGHFVAEIVATAGLITLVVALARTRRSSLAAPCVAAYIGAAYWFTSSTSFANPAVTVGRMFSDTFAGIAPTSVPSFIGAQIVGAAVGVGIIVALYPHGGTTADTVVFPATETQS